MKEVSDEYNNKLLTYSKELFEQSGNDPDYPFGTWEEQYEECKKAYTDGWLSDKFLDFATK